MILMAYNDKEDDQESGHFLAKQISVIIDRKELSATK